MKISILHQLARHITTYHFLSCFVVFLVVEVDGGTVKSELRTKLLLQNIRTHLAQQVDEVVQQKECDSGLTLCEPSKGKEEEEDEGSEEIPPPPKIRGHHKPLIKVNPKDVIQTMIHKAHKPLTKKVEKDAEPEKDVKVKKGKKTADEDDDDEDNDDDNDVKPTVKIKKSKPKSKSKKMEDKSEGSGFPEDIHVFAPTTNIVKSPLCRKHSRVYLRQLKRYKMWALMMYDASAKLPSGILQGNINQYGDFDECLAINAVFKNRTSKRQAGESSGIQGRYCLATIDVAASNDNTGLRQAVYRSQSYAFVRSKAEDPGHFIPRFSSINWGLCVPSACHARDVEKSIELSLTSYNETSGLIFNVKVDKDSCVTKEDTQFYFSFMTLLTILFYASVIGTTGYATYKDLYPGEETESTREEPEQEDSEKEIREESKAKEPEEPEKNDEKKTDATEDNKTDQGTEENAQVTEKADEGKKESSKQGKWQKLRRIMMAFSLKKNVTELLRGSESEDDIVCIHGIKSVFTIMLYFAHKTIPLALTPFNNRIVLTQISNEASSVLLRASIIYTDSFLLISGVLTSYNLSKEIINKGRIAWVKRSIARFIRLTPALFAVVLFYAYVSDHLGSGPIWNVVVRKNAQLCQENMWKNLFYIQNFFAFEKMCAPQTHQLALDMQLSLLAPLMVYLLHRYDKIGLGALQATFLLSSIMRYVSTSNNDLSLIIFHGEPVSQLYRTANILYSQTLHRATPYILGVTIGYYLKKFDGGYEFPKPFVAIGWIAAFCFGFLSVVTPSHLAELTYQYDVDEAAQYAALSPIAWSLALGWVIVACHLGYGGKVNEYLCNRGLIIFSKISYAVYLTQFLVFFYRVGIKRIPETFTFTGSFNVTELIIVIVISIIVTLLFDLPMKEIRFIILERDRTTASDTEAEETQELEEPHEPVGEEGEGSLQLEEDEIIEELIDDMEFEHGEDEGEYLDEIDDLEEEYEDEPPTRRSGQPKFDEDSDDKEFWENENRELEEKEKRAKAEKSDDFWGENED